MRGLKRNHRHVRADCRMGPYQDRRGAARPSGSAGSAWEYTRRYTEQGRREAGR
jgi:hypothetical protein